MPVVAGGAGNRGRTATLDVASVHQHPCNRYIQPRRRTPPQQTIASWGRWYYRSIDRNRDGLTAGTACASWMAGKRGACRAASLGGEGRDTLCHLLVLPAQDQDRLFNCGDLRGALLGARHPCPADSSLVSFFAVPTTGRCGDVTVSSASGSG